MLFDYYVTLVLIVIINEMASEVPVHEVATWVVDLRELEALDREAFPVVVDQTLVVEVSCLAALTWVVPQMAEDHEKVVGLLFLEVVVAGLVEGDRKIFLEGEAGRQVVWDL